MAGWVDSLGNDVNGLTKIKLRQSRREGNGILLHLPVLHGNTIASLFDQSSTTGNVILDKSNLVFEVDPATTTKEKPAGYVVARKGVASDNLNAPIEIPFSSTFLNKEEHIFLTSTPPDWRMKSYFEGGSINHELPFFNPENGGYLSQLKWDRYTAALIYNFLNGYRLGDAPDSVDLLIRPPFHSGSDIESGHINHSIFFRQIQYPSEELKGVELLKTVAAIKLLLTYRKKRNERITTGGLIDPQEEDPASPVTDLSFADLNSSVATIFRSPDIIRGNVRYGEPIGSIYDNSETSLMYLRKMVAMIRTMYSYLSEDDIESEEQNGISEFRYETLEPHRWWLHPFYTLPMDYLNEEISEAHRNTLSTRTTNTNKALFVIPPEEDDKPVDQKLADQNWNGSNLALNVIDGHLYHSDRVSETITTNLSIVGSPNPPTPILDIYVIGSEPIQDEAGFLFLNEGAIYQGDGFEYRIIVTDRNNWSKWNAGANRITPYPESDRKLSLIDSVLGLIRIYGGNRKNYSTSIDDLSGSSDPLTLLNNSTFIKRTDGSIHTYIPFTTTIDLVGYRSSGISDDEIASSTEKVSLVSLRSITPTDDAITGSLKNEKIQINHTSIYSRLSDFLSPDKTDTLFVSRPQWMKLTAECNLLTCTETIKTFLTQYRVSFPRLSGDRTIFPIAMEDYMFDPPEWLKNTQDGIIDGEIYSKEYVELNRVTPVSNLIYGMRYSGRADAADMDFYPIILHELTTKNEDEEEWNETVSLYSEYLRGISGDSSEEDYKPEEISLINKMNYNKLLAVSVSDNKTIDGIEDIEKLKVTRTVDFAQIKQSISNVRIGVAASYVMRYSR